MTLDRLEKLNKDAEHKSTHVEDTFIQRHTIIFDILKISIASRQKNYAGELNQRWRILRI